MPICNPFRLRLFILLVFIGGLVFAQKESAYWYFGKKAGLHFTDTGAQTDLSGELSASEGCSSISNNNGELLFYTDGISVWNRNHGIMPNGQGLLRHPSSTQSPLLFPSQIQTLFFIFHSDQYR